MPSRDSVKAQKKQQGLALLVLIIVVVLAFAAYSLSGLSINQVRSDQKNQTRVTLKNAKDALIAYAVTHSDRSGYEGEMGYLPCPDWNSGAVEGGSDANCGNAQTSTVGYFPWVSVDTPMFSDNSGSCLWYAVSGSYKKPNSSISMINEDSNGLFQIMNTNNNIMIGNNPEDRIVAIIFAPDVTLTNQSRTFDNSSFCGKDYGSVSEYLEGNGIINNGVFDGNADAIDQFIHATENSESETTPYNDQFIAVTRNEIWSAIVKRNDFNGKMKNLTEALTVCLSNYAKSTNIRRLPWVSPISLVDYRINNNYDDSDGAIEYSGRIPFVVNDSNEKMNLTGSGELFEQAGCNNLALPAAGITVDLVTANSEYRKLWNNWKDHFFYVLSEDYEMDELAETVGLMRSIRSKLNDTKVAIEGGDISAAVAAVVNALIEKDVMVVSAVDAAASANALLAAAVTPEEILVANSEVASATAMNAAASDMELAAIAMMLAAPIPGAIAAADAAMTDADAAVTAAELAAQPECLPVNNPINCIKVDPNPAAATPAVRAGMVVFSGSRLVGQLRNGPVAVGDTDTKKQVINYIENNNAADFPDNLGSGYYETVGGASNDIMYCIETNLDVIECL